MRYAAEKRGGMRQVHCIWAALAIVLLLTACSSAGAKQDTSRPYDYYIDCTTREQLEALAGEDFVEDVFAFSLMQFVLPDNGTGRERRPMLLATESFDSIDASSFERQMLLKEDPAILQSPDRNPILIDESLSKAEGLSVGDTLVLPNRLTDEPVVFTVGAIYRRISLFAQYDAVILCNEQIKSYSDQERAYITKRLKEEAAACMGQFWIATLWVKSRKFCR